MTIVVDLLIVLLVLATAAATVAAATPRAAATGLIALGILLALAWVRLEAVDVALTEAAIGGGATGVLLLRAAGRLRPVPATAPAQPVRAGAALVAAAVAVALGMVVLSLPPEAPSLAAPAAAQRADLGLGNPVTAVLLGYRAIDTLLEKIVMLLAVVGVWALARDDAWGRAPAPLADPADDGTLALLARGMVPVGVVFAVYMVWTGADHPGGTFQGGAILAGLWLVAAMAGLSPLPRADDRRLRLALSAGPAAFLAAGFAGSLFAGAFLAYPPGLAKPIIVTVEILLTVTVAAVVMLLVAGPPSEQRR